MQLRLYQLPHPWNEQKEPAVIQGMFFLSHGIFSKNPSHIASRYLYVQEMDLLSGDNFVHVPYVPAYTHDIQPSENNKSSRHISALLL
jgi:hypothetical protein